ncbi:cellulase family glycosylhydrolase [Balneolaceae bacterium]|jgi:hypothetical protein|nr:cellulase family glycosylhydrolase [Balneolaceae bacterium]
MSYRNKRKNYMVLGCILTGLLSQARGSAVENELGRLRVQGQEIVNDQGPFLIKSIGTGNWMIQEGYMMQSTDAGIGTHTQFRTKLEQEIGEERTADFYQDWLDNHMTKADLDSMKAWGFNAIRPALHYKWFTLPIQDEPVSGQHTWVDAGFEKLDELMGWAAANQMYVMFDMHGAPGGQGKNSNINDYDETLPSLFEDEANKDKLEALWIKLAQRYKDNPWFGGYDLINEPNWRLGDSGNENGCGTDNNDELWDVHLRLTKSIRQIDPNNIIYLSGNCWGNNYNSFEAHPLSSYDDNTVITFHKYWNQNDQESIQWAVDMREQYNRPLWMSESGENSNQWFADAIHLFESNNIGWSWWPVKKSRTNNIFKVTTPESYYQLLQAWENGESLSAEQTYHAVMEYSKAHRHENTTVAPDVIYALINNEDPTATKAYRHHGVDQWIPFVDYDLGRDGYAYEDRLSQNIHDEQGQWKVWNEGRKYRNDGVDIGGSAGGYFVSWTEPGEWLQFTIQVPQAGEFKLELETKGAASRLRMEINDEIKNDEIAINTGSENSPGEWATTTVNGIELSTGEHKIRFHIQEGAPDLRAFRLVSGLE